jgi:hypothetical protein
MFDRKDLELVSKAYLDGKAEGGMLRAHKRACDVLIDRHPELSKVDEPTLTLRVSQVLSTAVLARYLEIRSEPNIAADWRCGESAKGRLCAPLSSDPTTISCSGVRDDWIQPLEGGRRSSNAQSPSQRYRNEL